MSAPASSISADSRDRLPQPHQLPCPHRFQHPRPRSMKAEKDSAIHHNRKRNNNVEAVLELNLALVGHPCVEWSKQSKQDPPQLQLLLIRLAQGSRQVIKERKTNQILAWVNSQPRKSKLRLGSRTAAGRNTTGAAHGRKRKKQKRNTNRVLLLT